jgi:hypothetical protein
MNRGQHGPDVVVGGVVEQPEAVDEPVGQERPRRRVVAEFDQELPDRVLKPAGEAAIRGWMVVDGLKEPITRRRSASCGWSRSSMARTWESIAAASTAPVWTRWMAR